MITVSYSKSKFYLKPIVKIPSPTLLKTMKSRNSIYPQKSPRINPKTIGGYYIHFFILNATTTILVAYNFTYIIYMFTYIIYMSTYIYYMFLQYKFTYINYMFTHILYIFTYISYKKTLDFTYKLTYTISILIFR